jgi:hypothetical protein
LETRTLSAPWLVKVTWEELLTLTLCLALDVLEFLIPVFLTPIYGDIMDFAGFLFCLLFFGYIGFLSLLELIPSLDILPFFTVTWLIWYIQRRRIMKNRMLTELDKWR